MFQVLTINDSNTWNDIVRSFKTYDVYYLPEYTEGFKIHGDGGPTLFYYESPDIKAINVVMKRDIAMDRQFLGELEPMTYYDISTPYGYGGFIVEGEVANQHAIQHLNDEFCALCKHEGIVSEFVRFHPVLENHKGMDSVYDVTELGETITLNLESKEKIWDNFTSKNRNVIRKAINSGVKIFWGRSQALYDEFYELYNATMRRDNATNYYFFSKEFYNSILFDLKHNSLMFYAVYANKIISMSIIIFSNHSMHYHLSAMDVEYKHLSPTNLLLYEAACWGLNNGMSTFHLGGGLGSKEDSLYKFKKVFNKNSNTRFSIGRKIFDEEKYRMLTKLKIHDDLSFCESSFFPAYRK